MLFIISLHWSLNTDHYSINFKIYILIYKSKQGKYYMKYTNIGKFILLKVLQIQTLIKCYLGNKFSEATINILIINFFLTISWQYHYYQPIQIHMIKIRMT